MGVNNTQNRFAGLLAGVVASPIVLVALAGAPAHGSACTVYAAPHGDDGAAGSAQAPFRTAQKLVNSLGAGQTGCLAAGATFVEDVRIDRDGAPGAPIRLAGEPGPPPTVKGRMLVMGDRVEVIGLALDGRNDADLPSPTVHGDDVVFRGNDVTNFNTEICFAIGSDASDPPSYGIAHRTVIDDNRIHNCGELPATNLDHGIYVAGAHDTAITNNYIYDNADRGVQLFPDAQRTLVANNVIDGNGQNVNFGGWNGLSSSNNTVRDNIISNAKIRANVESWWGQGSSPGVGNVVQSNCLWNGASGNFTGSGYLEVGNHTADPGFANPAGKDFSVDPSGACRGDGPNAAPYSGPPPGPAGGSGPDDSVGFGDTAHADQGSLADPFQSSPSRPGRPTVTSSISKGAVLTGSVKWSATVQGAKPSSVEFLVDGQLVWTERVAPFVVNGGGQRFDTRGLENGPHRFVIRARKGKKVVARSRVKVEVDNARRTRAAR